ncbi:MAG: hypothetical protein U0166_10310 [Acidobacteriota bacterium]
MKVLGWARIENPFARADLALSLKRGNHHGLRATLALMAACLVAVLPTLGLDAGRLGWQAEARPRALAGLALSLALTIVVVAGFSGASLAREKASGTIELLLLSGRSPREILAGKLLASTIAGAPLFLQIGIVAALAHPALGIAASGAALLALAGIAASLVMATVVVCYEVVTGTSRPHRFLPHAAALLLTALAAATAVRPAPSRLALPRLAVAATAIAAMMATGAFLDCRASRVTLGDRRDRRGRQAPRRRFSTRRLTGDVRRPVLEASRIPTHRSYVTWAAIAVALVVYPLALRAPASSSAALMHHLAIGIYLPAMAFVLAAEALAVNPASSGFAILAATPLPSLRILGERAIGKLSMAPAVAIPFGSLLLHPPRQSAEAASAAGLAVSYAALVYGATIAARARRPGGSLPPLDVLCVIALLAEAFEVLRCVGVSWTGLGVAASGRAMVLIASSNAALALLAWRAAVRHLETARRSVA